MKGCITALVTPFKAGKVDEDSLAALIEWQLASGVNGFVVLGTTAETATLSEEEKLLVLKRVKDLTKGRVPLIAGTGTNCTKHTIENTRLAKELGYDAALVVSPYYNKPTQAGLFEHFSAVAKDGGLPIIIYNIPGRTAVDISAETFAKLSTNSTFIGVKEASGSAGKLMDIVEATEGRMPLYAGDCNLTYLCLALGGNGVISASANAIPREMTDITDLYFKGDRQGSLNAQIKTLPAIRAMFIETNPAPAKAALKFLGKIADDELRLPLVRVKPETRALMERVLKELN